MKTAISQQTMDAMIKDRKVRVAITRESHWYFFHFYFAHYVKCATADFQRDIISLTENETVQNFFVIAFRGSGKSTIVTTSYPLWAILGRQQKKFVLLLGQTRIQAKQHMMNIKRELETNELLKSDLGPFEEESDEWGSTSLVFKNHNARITAVSTEQGIRGLRHNQHRPDLIIGDDVEDLSSVKTREGRDKTYAWLTGEVIPAGDQNTRLIIVGNLLHEDSLLMRIRQSLVSDDMEGIFKSIPLLDATGVIAWPGKYRTVEDIETEKKRVGSNRAWLREYLLILVPDDDQVVDPAWIRRYAEMPRLDSEDYVGTFLSVDPAVSEDEKADCTAMIMASVFGDGEDRKIYVHPHVVNDRLSYFRAKELVKVKARARYKGYPVKIIVEGGGFQKALFQELEREGFDVAIMNTGGIDKKERLTIAAALMESGQVFFPMHGTKELESQLTRFNVEKHDDLADAFSMLIRYVQELVVPMMPEVWCF